MTNSSNKNEYKPYVIVGPNGLEYVGLHLTKDTCWTIYLGWPSQEDIDWYKNNGYYCAEANLTWREPE